VGDRQRRCGGSGTTGRLRLVQHRHARPSDRADGGRRRGVRGQGSGQNGGKFFETRATRTDRSFRLTEKLCTGRQLRSIPVILE